MKMSSAVLVILLWTTIFSSTEGINHPELFTCESQWIKVLETDAQGQAIYGQKSHLVDAVNSASTIRIYIPELDLAASTQNAHVSQNEVCVQSLFHVAKVTWNSFAAPLTWRFHFVCSTGNYHIAEYILGPHSRPVNPDTRGNVAVRWFVRHNGCGSGADSAVFCNNDQGSPTCGSIQDLVSTVRNGAEIRYTSGTGYMVPTVNNVAFNQNNLVSAQSLWHVSMRRVGNRAEFKGNDYWWFTILSTDGSRDMSRWNIGYHVSRGHTSDRVEMKWFADTCWSLAYKHTALGEAVDGTLDLLRASVRAGRRVRVVIDDNYALEPDNVFLKLGQVSAQLLGHVSKASISRFQNNVYWYWQIVSSTGLITTTRVDVGSSTKRGDTRGTASVAWYVDKRPWRRLLSVTSCGRVSMGSKEDLTNALTSGSMLQVVVTFEDETTLTFSPDSIAFHQHDVAAQFGRYIGTKTDMGCAERSFPTSPYWRWTIVTTEGELVSSDVKAGTTDHLGDNTVHVSIDWYVN